jgi:predicted helicase
MSEENVARISRQNKKRISVVIGNPPYNANQLNENENNKNREYPEIDRRIKATYIAASTAQKTKLYDMYARFFRWASDRVDENGIVAFVSNSSFVHKPSFDGFRKTATKEFNDIWIVDLKGDARSSGERRRQQGGNIFGDQIKVGITISFFIKKRGTSGCRIRYQAVRDYAKVDEKSDFLKIGAIGERQFDELKPDKNGNWVSVVENDFQSLLPIADKDTKSTTVAGQERALEAKIKNFIAQFDQMKPDTEEFPEVIKWSRNLKRRLRQKRREVFSRSRIVRASYRPYSRRWLYQSDLFIDEAGASAQIFPPGNANAAICFSDIGSRTDYCVLAIDGLADLHFGAAVDAYQQVSRFRFAHGERVDNITDFALNQLQNHYKSKRSPQRAITKDAIFHYVYAVLYDPIYRAKYVLNLRREFPRIPFYADFWRWADWGETLMALHLGYEVVEPWPLERIDAPDDRSRKAGLAPKAILKADRDAGSIRLDSETQLIGVPPQAWTYKLGNRSALEWILDQHKEKTPKDPTIREKFNTYRFAPHKDKVIDLLKRVTRVSVETMKIVEAMRQASHST